MADRIVVANPSKALIALVGMVCITVLMALNRIPSEAGTGLIGSILGYAIGNGIAAAARQPVQPIIGRRQDQQ